jgi:amino acid transporter
VGFGFLTILLAVAVALIYGMSFLGLLVLRGIQPLLDAVTPRFWVVLLSPMGLVAVGLLIIVVGLPRTRRVRRPARWRAGVIALGLAFSTFWPLQFLAARIDVSFPEFRTALHLLAGFVSICLLTGGLELIRMANNTGEDDSWEFLN